MRTNLILASAFAALAFTAIGSQAHAANARHPYENVDRRNDRGNDTGDAQVERLNNAQLDQNYGQGGAAVAAPSGTMPATGAMPMGRQRRGADQTTIGGEE